MLYVYGLLVKLRNDEDQKTETSSIVVHKLRGEMSRSFDYSFDWKGITVLEPADDDDEVVAELMGKKSELPQAIMIAIRESEYKRKKVNSLVDLFPANSRSAIEKALATLRDDGLIRNDKGGWALTKTGLATAHKGPTARELLTAHKLTSKQQCFCAWN